MATLNFSHTEDWGGGLRHDFYYCSACGAQQAFQAGTLPELDTCPECGEQFEGVDHNDQIGG